MLRPRPTPPFLPIYPESMWPELLKRHQQDVKAWQRETTITEFALCLAVLVPTAGIVAAALMIPRMAVDAIMVLAK